MSAGPENNQDLSNMQELELFKYFESSEIVLNTFYLAEHEEDELNIVFKINDFHLLQKNNGEAISSAVFEMKKNPFIRWSLKVYPNGIKKKNNEDFLSVFLLLNTEDSNMIVTTHFSIAIQNSNSDFGLRNFAPGVKFSTKTNSYGWVEIIKTKDLMKNVNFLPNNVLTILCSVKSIISSKTWTCTKPTLKTINVEDNNNINNCLKKRKLSFDSNQEVQYKKESSNIYKNPLEIMYEDKCCSDVTIIVDDNKIKAHKCVLVASSPIFSTLLENSQSERPTLTISDISYEVVSEMLKFIYTKRVACLQDMADGLMIAAHKYEILDLKKICEEFLSENINLENALKLLITADSHSAEHLKKSVFDFIIKHREDFIDNCDFQELMISNPKLMQPLLIRSLVSLTFYIIFDKHFVMVWNMFVGNCIFQRCRVQGGVGLFCMLVKCLIFHILIFHK